MSVRIPYDELKDTIYKALLNIGMPEDKAQICAKIHADSSADGVESHGANRVPRFVEYVRKGWVDVNADPEKVGGAGAVENYDGHTGTGITNALFCADRAAELAKEHGIGMVTLRNTTHWMRGGTYAWHIANKGLVGISWINTESCMPMWGSDEQGVGNNPFCMAVPRENGPIVLDMAMSQYAYGKLGVYRLAGKQLPYPGGFDEEGNLTSDPGAIEKSRRILPTGYWKGSSMALVLDMLAAGLAGGLTGSDIDKQDQGSCTNCCQIFIAIDPYLAGTKEEIQEKWDARVAAADATHPINPARPVTCPGEGTSARREDNLKNGVKVDEQVWEQIKQVAAGNLDVVDIAST